MKLVNHSCALALAAGALLLGCADECPGVLVRQGDRCVCPPELKQADGGCADDGAQDAGVTKRADSAPADDALADEGLQVRPDKYATDQGTPLEVQAPEGLLSNDSGATDIRVASTQRIFTSVGGEVRLSADGSLVYEPADEFWGVDSFEYTAVDEEGAEAKGHVRIVVRATHIDLAWLEAKSLGGFALVGEEHGDFCGASVDIGDFNGDGLGDLVIGAHARKKTYVVYGRKDRDFGASVELSRVGVSISGLSITGYLSSLSVGDVNGDGVGDLILGDAAFSSHGLSNNGRVYVIYGSRGHISGRVELSEVGTRVPGFVLAGEHSFDFAGTAVSPKADFNGDGIQDLAIGASADQNDRPGRSYVVFGSRESRAGATSLAEVGNSLKGVVLRGEGSRDWAGRAVVLQGDLNGDGLGDLSIGAPMHRADATDAAGRVYVVFGSRHVRGSRELASLGVGLPGFVLDGNGPHERLGKTIGGMGDFNGDGVDDLLVGGEKGAYLVLGSDEGSPAGGRIRKVVHSSRGMVLEAEASVRSLCIAGDLNGDGRSDLVLGDQNADANREGSGRAYALLGAQEVHGELSVLSLGATASGFVMDGADRFDGAGYSSSTAGDIDGDGLADLLIGAPGAGIDGKRPGKAYLLYGAPTDL